MNSEEANTVGATEVEQAEVHQNRTVTYVDPSKEAEKPKENASDSEAAGTGANETAEDHVTASSAKIAQFLPQNGYRCETPWQFWYYQRQTPFFTQVQ